SLRLCLLPPGTHALPRFVGNIMHNLNKKGNFVHIKTQRERAAPWHRSFLFACPVKAQGWRMK
ncbi:MAG TPA: hypothetical protein PLM62_13840, partial [Zoogloea sp.]|nr:hypothetical protein [Zoogloea sp.]